MADYYIYIDDVDLRGLGFLANKAVRRPTPSIEHHTESVPGRDGLFDLGSNLGQRELIFSGQMYADTLAELESNLSAVRKLLYGAAEKRIRCSRWPDRQFYGKLSAPFDPAYWDPQLASAGCDLDVRMQTITRPWAENIYESHFSGSLPSGRLFPVSNQGDLAVPPVITLRVVGASAGSVEAITITNTQSDVSLTLGGSYNFGTDIIIDCDNHTVTADDSSDMANQTGRFFDIAPDVSGTRVDEYGVSSPYNVSTTLKFEFTQSSNARLLVGVMYRERFL